MSVNRNARVVVVGAGAFGGWTALHLLRSGVRVTLFDSWGPGNSRSSSGGETRAIRATYGPDEIYVRMVIRSLQLWRENQQHWNLQLYHRTGSVWLAGQDDAFEKAAVHHLRSAGVIFETLLPAEASRRFPQFNFDGISYAIHEEDGGYLLARQACAAVLSAFLAGGGEYRQTAVQPGEIASGKMRTVRAADGSKVQADQFVFACGPWLGKMFPDVIGDRIRPTRQEVFFFGTPAGDARVFEERMPVWIDHGGRFMYGIPGNQWRGFKISDHRQGIEIDPTSSERLVSAESLQKMRRYLGFRFPALADVPLLESRVCQYENTPDEHFLIDRHPAADNVWLVGGGSGHGFKHSPAIGEIVAQLVRGHGTLDPFFQLARLETTPCR